MSKQKNSRSRVYDDLDLAERKLDEIVRQAFPRCYASKIVKHCTHGEVPDACKVLFRDEE